jgi:hypothetical protein
MENRPPALSLQPAYTISFEEWTMDSMNDMIFLVLTSPVRIGLDDNAVTLPFEEDHETSALMKRNAALCALTQFADNVTVA